MDESPAGEASIIATLKRKPLAIHSSRGRTGRRGSALSRHCCSQPLVTDEVELVWTCVMPLIERGCNVRCEMRSLQAR